MRHISGRARLTTWQELSNRRPDLVVAPELGGSSPRVTIVGERTRLTPHAALCLPGAVVLDVGVIFDEWLIVDDAHYVPDDWMHQSWLPFVGGDHGFYEYDLPVSGQIAGAALFVDSLNGRRNMGHFVFDTLPYAMVQRDLAAAGHTVPALLPEWAFESQRILAGRLFEAQVPWNSETVEVEQLLLVPRQTSWTSRLRRVPLDAFQRLTRALPELVDAQNASPTGRPVYLWRPWGVFGEASALSDRDLTNGSQIDDEFRAAGYHFVDAGSLPVTEVLAAVASAPVVAGLHGAQCAHVLWANRHARFVELTGPFGAWSVMQLLAAAAGIDGRQVRATAVEGGRPLLQISDLKRAIAR